VDPSRRVYGVSGLRVCDASIMPTLMRGNTNVPILMLAEKTPPPSTPAGDRRASAAAPLKGAYG